MSEALLLVALIGNLLNFFAWVRGTEVLRREALAGSVIVVPRHRVAATVQYI